ncbi:glycosyltransferase family 2 protein [Dyadobacter aurulentus]|uniref:glycosyltransferase family 2 protein n=1 Tax=Dyadobacter sp. UC 10 TaxID=2605428 RepID=UPI0011F21176|nr:glycosyltransferase family 2 protein [Dyadobacter sp. UC 10]KAA0989666.1 glycosyltransferase [Dyadobacter sp. UC 10]
MDNQPRLTIITVTYNAERFVERTLKSVRAAMEAVENPALVEYLIVDGESKDGTIEICERYSDLISRIISEKDKGIYDAMNKGIALARGKYLWFLNAGDEIYAPNVMKNLLGILESGADVHYSDAMMVDESGAEQGLRSQFTPHSLSENISWKDFNLGMKICHQAFIAKKDIAPFYDITNLSADIDWEINCLKRAGSIRLIPFVLCRYLLGGTSVKKHRRSLADRFKVLKKHFGLLPTMISHLKIVWRGILFAAQRGKYW